MSLIETNELVELVGQYDMNKIIGWLLSGDIIRLHCSEYSSSCTKLQRLTARGYPIILSNQQQACMMILTGMFDHENKRNFTWVTKWYEFGLALRLCYDEITCRGEALLQEMKGCDIIKSWWVGFVWSKWTSAAEGITCENSEIPLYLYLYFYIWS